MSLHTFLAVGLGGFFGAVSRVYLIGAINRMVPHHIPLGTLGVNLFGSLLIGMLFAYFMHQEVSPTMKSFLTTGFLGALTTYSTFAIESYFLLHTNLTVAILNILLNAVGTIIFAAIGYKIAGLLLT